MNSFDPVKASNNIVIKYKRYLNTIFNISDPLYNKQFQKALSHNKTYAKGPYLDITDSFSKGKSIKELIEKGILPKSFENIHMPISRPLYEHQENAIRKVINGRNIVVSTGTGSGKTESFLVPILKYIIEEDECGKLTPGIRALIIYPMNALANDQLGRLRSLLKDYPAITFGSYTGQTKEKYDEALVEYKALNNGDLPLSNELICRNQMKSNPPHIFITNYAMLEYLMLRPDDSVFFSGEYANTWKYIVLDEAHVYNGSTGIEVSMLLRRLKAKIDNDKIIYILTSATLGGNNDNKEVADFASSLCASNFDEKDVIRACKEIPAIQHEKHKLDVKLYQTIAYFFNNEEPDEVIINYLSQTLKINQNTITLNEILYDLVVHDENYWKIRELLKTPQTIDEIAAKMKWTQSQVADFVTVASKCEKNEDKLFDARYHMFIRATESVFITLNPSNKLFLTRKDYHIENGVSYKVFEIATCASCHAIYLVGKMENNYLKQSSGYLEPNQRTVFLLGEQMSDTDIDHNLNEEQIEANAYEICACCGFIRKIDSHEKTKCEHDHKYYSKVIRVDVKNDQGKLTKCLSCENTNYYGILRMFYSGHEAVTSVLATALFEELPSYTTQQHIYFEEDETGFGVNNLVMEKEKIKQAKQFIAFSDNRQAAAFFACYLDQTYRNILYKRLIIEALSFQKENSRPKRAVAFIDDLIYQFEKNEVLSDDIDVIRKEAWKALLHELVDNNGNSSLARMGLLGISIDDSHMIPNTNYKLSAQEVATICNVIALGMMADAAITYDEPLNKAEREYFTYNGIEYRYTLSDNNSKEYIRSFIPSSLKYLNKRMDYLARVLEKKGFILDRKRISELLIGIWKNIFIRDGILQATEGGYKINIEKVMVSKPKEYFICSKCKKVTPFNIEGVCPSYRCDGKLEKVSIQDVFSENHYYRIYQDLDIRNLRVVEHTAQLDKETAYSYQKKFQRKEVDILSCSTTFEMGVDVGTLETVFMRNMPPSPANYAQRAGRAGRSKKSVAYAITFCNKSNHDFSFFNAPEKMIRGKINPPKFNVENDKIAVRHLFASAFSFFWKRYPQFFSNAAVMATTSNNQISGYDCLVKYLMSKPEDLKVFCDKFLPVSLRSKFGISTFQWVKRLINNDEDDPGVLTKAINEYNYEVKIIEEAINRAIKTESKNIAGLFERKRVYENEEILSFLSRKNVLPKYGFPVDTVELSITDRSANNNLGLELQRDLQMAISEYAPGSQVVANGKLITSRYIKRVPNMSWKMFDYLYCGKCNSLNIEPHVIEDEYSNLTHCHQCNSQINKLARKTFLIPEFGFEADGSKIQKPSLIKPDKTYRNDIAYVGTEQIRPVKFRIGKADIELYISQSDKMVILNESNFYVCESCGFTDLDEKHFMYTKKMKHKNASGYFCSNNMLKRYSLGYRFETDVLQLRFLNPDLADWEVAISVLYALLKGISNNLNIDQNDISGCLQYFYNSISFRPNYALIFYDRTPGGAGYVKRINNHETLYNVIKETFDSINECNCGGEAMDSSCYSCLRNYYNQKYHDILKRRYVIDFLRKVLDK